MKKTVRTQRTRRMDCERAGLHRRSFLGLVSAAAALPLVGGYPRSLWADPGDALGEAAQRPLHVGYLRGSSALVGDPAALGGLSRPQEPPVEEVRRMIPAELPLEVVSADEIDPFEGHLATPRAEVWIHGLYPRTSRDLSDRFDSLEVEIELMSSGGGSAYPFFAWSMETRPILSVSSPTRFVVGVGDDHGFRLRLKTARRLPAIREFLEQRFGVEEPVATRSTLREHYVAEFAQFAGYYGQPLRAGTYFIPLDPSAVRSFPMVANYEYLAPDGTAFLLLSIAPLDDGAGDIG